MTRPPITRMLVAGDVDRRIGGEESSLPKKIQALGMLVISRELDCRHIWNAHAASARQAGVRSEIVDALRECRGLPGLAADEAAVVDYGREFFSTHRVSRGTLQTPP